MDEHVRVTVEGGVMRVVLARPDRRNAITVAMYDALADSIEAANSEPGIRLVMLSGEGEDFTAGNDLMDFMAAVRPEAIGDLPVGRFLTQLARNEVPMLAAVRGNAIGIGTTMLLHCDLVVAEASARFKMPFVELGLVPEAASSLILPRLAGRRAAARMLLLGESFSASEALAAGIASHVVPDGELEAQAERIAATLLSRPAEALSLTQRLLRRADRDEVERRMTEESAHFGERLQSDELKQAIADFFAARAAR